LPGDSRIDAAASLVGALRPADDDERRHRDAILHFLGTRSRPFDRETHDHLTAGGIVVDGDRILVVHHRRLGLWVQPGGHIDPDDADPAAAAVREVAEETSLGGLVAERLLDVDVHSVDCGGRSLRHLDLRFLMRAGSGDPAPNDEVTAVRWVSFGELGALGADAGVRRAAAKAFGR
jgi:8-oxo-dGTP pyrophosphatase MutT (NUDIX family)